MWKRTSWCLLMCILCSQGLLTSIIALGWIYRWVRYKAVKQLFQQSPKAQIVEWELWAAQQAQLASVIESPRFFKHQLKPKDPPSLWQTLIRTFHSLALNFKVGLVGILSTWTLTLLPAVLWAVGWYIGWQISFTKMYEGSATGSSLGSLGILLFSIAMLYVPMAQSRQALTSDWRSFFQARLIKTIIWTRPFQLFLLAAIYTVCTLIVNVFKGIPSFLTLINPALADLSPQEALDFIEGYYFYTGIIAVLIVVKLRTISGSIYTRALVDLWSRGILKPEDFHPEEVKLLQLFEIPYGLKVIRRSRLRQLALRPMTVSYRSAMLVSILLLWGGFNFIPFVSQFVHHDPVRGFLNQPLVQLPYFQYVPEHLRQNLRQ